MRRSVSEAALAQPEGPLGTDSLKSLTLHDLSLKGSSETSENPELSLSAETLASSTPSDVNFLLQSEGTVEAAKAQEEMSTKDRSRGVGAAFPEGFHPRRSSQGATRMPLYSSPIAKNPFMSPLLAPDSMLQSLPPVHIVVSARPGHCIREEWGGWGPGAPGEENSREGEEVGSPERDVPSGGKAWQREDGRESGLPFSFAILSTKGQWGSRWAWRVREGERETVDLWGKGEAG